MKELCKKCLGSGRISQLQMSQTALQNISKLAEILPKEPVPIKEIVCPECHGLGEEL